MARCGAGVTLLLVSLYALLPAITDAGLQEGFYKSNTNCTADVEATVASVVQQYVSADRGVGAGLIRLHFHDCFVLGCDGSILLDNMTGMLTEKEAVPNMGSARGYDVVDAAKAALEDACPGVVSCADILALAAEISVELSGGPKWGVLLGRLDGKTSSISGANNLPAPFETLDMLRRKFRAVGLNSDVDLVALSGAHTFGRVQCLNIADSPADRLYNFSGTNRPDPTLDPAYRAFLIRRCPTKNGNSRVLNDLDPTTPDLFDKNYYTNLEVNRGILTSDQELKSSPQARGTTAPIVDQFARSQDAFFKSFAQSMINMGNIQPITDPSMGEVRCDCKKVNDS